MTALPPSMPTSTFVPLSGGGGHTTTTTTTPGMPHNHHANALMASPHTTSPRSSPTAANRLGRDGRDATQNQGTDRRARKPPTALRAPHLHQHPLLHHLVPQSILNLESAGLDHVPDSVLQQAPSLVRLSLADNELPSVPPSLFHLGTSLRVLRLDHNSLSSLLPDTATIALPVLESLHLAHNRLTSLPRSLGRGLPSLRLLDVSNNAITELPPSLHCLESTLITLAINSNPIVFPPQHVVASLVRKADDRMALGKVLKYLRLAATCSDTYEDPAPTSSFPSATRAPPTAPLVAGGSKPTLISSGSGSGSAPLLASDPPLHHPAASRGGMSGAQVHGHPSAPIFDPYATVMHDPFASTAPPSVAAASLFDPPGGPSSSAGGGASLPSGGIGGPGAGTASSSPSNTLHSPPTAAQAALALRTLIMAARADPPAEPAPRATVDSAIILASMAYSLATTANAVGAAYLPPPLPLVATSTGTGGGGANTLGRTHTLRDAHTHTGTLRTAPRAHTSTPGMPLLTASAHLSSITLRYLRSLHPSSSHRSWSSVAQTYHLLAKAAQATIAHAKALVEGMSEGAKRGDLARTARPTAKMLWEVAGEGKRGAEWVAWAVEEAKKGKES